MFNTPLGYFISFRTYGTWLHGDERGSVDRRHNRYGEPMLAASKAREAWEEAELESVPRVLTAEQRTVVDSAVRAVCVHRAWSLHELNVRTNHVHVVVTAPSPPEVVMNAFKVWATRQLRSVGLVGPEDKVWSRHGSTIYLFRAENFDEKCKYVRECQ
ncbi:MAG: transposase [Phycisphaerales bacterium]